MSHRRHGSAWPVRTMAPAMLAAAIAAPPALAATYVEFTFVGSVVLRTGEHSVPDHPWGHVQVGDPVVYSYVIDIDQEDQSSDPTFGKYVVESAMLSFDGIAFVPQTVGHMTVNLISSLGNDEVSIPMIPFGSQPGDGAGFSLTGGITTLPDDGIPIDFDLMDFPGRGVSYGDGASFTLGSQFESYSYQIVPAPGALAVLAAVFFRTRRRRRSPAHASGDRIDA